MTHSIQKMLAAHLISSCCDLSIKTRCIRVMFELDEISDEDIEANIDEAIRLAKKWSSND